MNVIVLIVIYLTAVNLIGLGMMGIDKYKARKHAWRIPESTLFVVALFGGGAGSWAGMYLFRHKTRKWYFVYGMPAILLFQAAVVFLISRLPVRITVM